MSLAHLPLVYVDMNTSLLPDGAEHRSPNQQIGQSVCIQVNSTYTSSIIRAELQTAANITIGFIQQEHALGTLQILAISYLLAFGFGNDFQSVALNPENVGLE